MINEHTLPKSMCRRGQSLRVLTRPNADAIKAAAMRDEQVPGAEVRRGSHLRLS
jgi:hypothetical protein